MREVWGAAKIWQCKNPGEAPGEGVSLVAVKGPELKGSYREVEAWNHEESLREAANESCSPVGAEETQDIGAAGTMG